MDTYFYLDQNGQQQGPVAANELPNYGVTRNIYVWKQGMSNWQMAGSIPELSDIFPPSITPVVPPSYQSQFTPQPQKPDSLMVWSVLVTLLCFLPTGIVAIIYSNKVDNLWALKDYEGAEQAANSAKTWCLVSLGLAVLLYVGAVVTFYVGWATFFGAIAHH